MLQRLTTLFRHVFIYGLGDVATSLVSLLLLPIFTRYLSPAEYGAVSMLVIVEAMTKIVFRWGVDTAFMRLYFDCTSERARQQLASTLFFFLLAVNGSLVLVGFLASDWLGAHLIGDARYGLLVALTIANTFVAGFFFLPYQVLRIRERSKTYIALTSTRSAGTILARLILVVGAGMGVTGIVLADVAVTLTMALILSPWFAQLIRPMFSRAILADAFRFGAPRIPHSLAQQMIGAADRYFLNRHATLADVGLYSIGATFGLALKLFLAAFEAAWTPFFLSVMREPDAKRTYRIVSTYVVAALVLLVTGVSALATDVVRLFTAPAFHGAAVVTPWIALGVMFQGLYIVGSIGLVITKRTTPYPIASGVAAAVSVAANLLLIPRFGMVGAAWATVIAYATLAGVTSVFAWLAYPISYEWSRLARVAVAGLVAYAAAAALVPATMPAAVGLLLHGAIVVGVYPAVLAVTGFFRAGELRLVRELFDRARQGRMKRPGAPATPDSRDPDR